MELNIEDLYKLFEDNNLSPKYTVVQEQKQTNNFIKVGDIVVTEFKGREFRGEVFRIYEKSGTEQYDVKVGQTTISVKFENILEHYPKNKKFETVKESVKVAEAKVETPKVETPKVETPKIVAPKIETPKVVVPKVIVPKVVEANTDEQPKIASTVDPVKLDTKKHSVEDSDVQKKKIPSKEEAKKIEKDKEASSPDNAKPETNEKLDSKTEVKVIGKVVHFNGLKLQEVNDFLTQKGILDKCWYFVSEKSETEIHIIRNNEKGFKIQPFVLSFMEIQVKGKKLNENASQIKIKGNNSFSIISEIPTELHDLVRNGLIVLLSK